ncbi:hypothetical protein Dsin_010830 [Dipteronia sinensis]|uniref:Disease resistance RPP13-like protein 1 n=1 Tax=Dipteronia sinensis TaxID=43782 RepID=A0AAE0ATZ6_9ROSI|nr:hypothetical protein Dsin_010830 [Dipteronia sinensis]
MALVETAVGAVLSAFLQVLFDRLASQQVIDFFKKEVFDVTVLERLNMILLTINAVLIDAEEKQITNQFVKDWVDQVKDAAYNAEDLLDEIATVASVQSAVSNNQVRNNTSIIKICNGFKDELEKMTSKLEKLAEQRSVLGLKESLGRISFPRLPSTSLVDKCKVFGRDSDKEEVMKFLLSDNINESEVPVIAITGMAGIGKTTLAQLLYNDSTVKGQFRTRAWAYVSEEFDVLKVTKTIYDSLCSRNCNITNLDLIQLRLQQKLTGKKFLLVLDDVWNENFICWDVLQNSFIGAARGSRIIVTTRSQYVASTMHAALIHPLQQLSKEHCWSVFAKYAFGSENVHVCPKLEAIKKNVVKRCQGLPLAAKLLGSLLHSVEVNEWDNILSSKLWDQQNISVLPSLRLSYYYLSANLKRCFAYCSIFPKGYVFEKEKLVLLWMAEGFLQQPRSEKRMEEVGNEYFHELLSRSFFQQSNDNKLGFEMHDLVNELAQFVSGQFAFKFESGKTFGISEKTRHFSYMRDQFGTPEKFEALHETKSLRTFLPLSSSSKFSQSCYINESVVNNFLPILRRLRVLSMSNCRITQFPDTFDKLKHLRYLDFSRTEIKVLPSTTYLLYNLHTLILSHCTKLIELPAKMHKLVNLGCLDLNGTKSLKEMPLKFGRLKNLRLLTTFVVSDNATGSSIIELGELLHLGGKLSILELQKIRNVADAENAKLKEKKNIKELVFKWNNNGLDQQTETSVLEKLRPHENLEKLSIKGYNGTKLPDWIEDSSFTNMVVLHFTDCKSGLSLPSFGQLSSLKELHVQNCPELTGRLAGYFPSLELLYIAWCWKLDFLFEDVRNYSNLRNLHIKSSCDSLMIFTLNLFHRLENLQLMDCRNLKRIEVSEDIHGELRCLQSLKIIDCHNLELFAGRGLPTPNLTSFIVMNCNGLLSMPEQMHTLLTSLEVLGVSYCPKIESFPIGGLPTNLQSLLIQNCDRLTPQEGWGLNNMTSLTSVRITGGCSNLNSFPQVGLLPTSLKCLEISEFPDLKSLNLSGFQFLDSIETLEINSCVNLRSMSDGRWLPSSISSLSITGCSLMTEQCQKDQGEDWPKISHIKKIVINGIEML